MPLAPLHARVRDLAAFVEGDFCVRRGGTGRLPGLVVGELLGKGSNSCVRRVSLAPVASECAQADDGYVLRAPRSNSDTVSCRHSQWECHVGLLAAQAGVGPTIFDAWFCPRSTRLQHRGLHMVLQHYETDLHDAILDRTEEFNLQSSEIASAIVEKVCRLGEMGILLFDLKPSNIVLNLDPLDVRIIDYGRDYCELRGSEHVTVIQSIDASLERHGCDDAARTKAFVLSCVMLVMLSAITTHDVQGMRHRLKTANKERRAQMNTLRPHLARMRGECSGRLARVVRETLRHDLVYTTLRHYLGARNSGTHRVLTAAGFCVDGP